MDITKVGVKDISANIVEIVKNMVHDKRDVLTSQKFL